MANGSIDLTSNELVFLYEIVKDLKKQGQSMLESTDLNDPEREDMLFAQKQVNSLYRKLKAAVSEMPSG